MRRATKLLSVAFGLVGLAACGDDGITFPELPSTLLTEFCVRGTASLEETVSGSVAATDCDAADVDPTDEGYYEVWRIRVETATAVTFDAQSEFDNYLTVLRLDSFTSTTAELTLIGQNDDRDFPADLNALVTVTLQPDTDYFVAIAGYDYTEVGPYTIEIR
ncbi:MAG TPA: hypothetical protein VFH97_09875 [Gemmatimonadales bacterium]|nr:hypothetical protein [Gemmatimonadales bacterium]